MKKIVCILILICICIVANTAEAALASKDTEAVPVIDLHSSDLEYSLLNCKKDAVTKEVIKIRNQLDEPLEIQWARSTSEYIKVNIEPQTVEKGGVFDAEIIFDSTGLDKEAELTVYIQTDSKKTEVIIFVVLVEIEK